MQNEIVAANPSTKIRLLGVNHWEHSGGNGTITMGRDLPWLQDSESTNCWSTWGVTQRDVVILDANGLKVDVYNLTQNNLSDPLKYAELKTLLKAYAGE